MPKLSVKERESLIKLITKLDRTLFKEPIILKPDETIQIEYKVKLAYNNKTPKDIIITRANVVKIFKIANNGRKIKCII